MSVTHTPCPTCGRLACCCTGPMPKWDDVPPNAIPSGSGSEPPANPHADDVCPGGCPFGLPAGHRIKDHPAFPESPPLGPLQALREAIKQERDMCVCPAAYNVSTDAALVSVEEQLAALQRAARMYRDEAHLVVPASQHHPEYIKALESLDAALARGSSPSSPKGDA